MTSFLFSLQFALLLFCADAPCSLGALLIDQPHYTFIFVSGIILGVFGIIYMCLGCCKITKPEPII